MNHKTLVPPLELCKLIPDGEFEDSAMVRCDRKPYILRREWIRKDAGRKDNVFPAPTVQEILEDLLKNTGSVFVKWSETAYHGWFVDVCNDRKSWRKDDRNLVIAAMQTWLNMKGINYPGEMEKLLSR